MLDFPIVKKRFDSIANHDLFMLPNGVYRAKSIKVDNYLYPMYFLKDGDDYIISTSVYALIHYKKCFIRNPKFQVSHFYRPSFLTIDQEVMRARTEYRRSSLELTEKEDIIKLGAKLIQEYITEIEKKYAGWVHIVLMGGKDSENIILTERNQRWIVISGEPTAALNREFIARNNIKIERFISVPDVTDDTFLLEEIMASDCMFDIAHFRWTKAIYDVVKEYDGRAVVWMGTDGDGIFAKNNNHRDKDYYALHDLHVGTAMGIWHQVLKNLLNVPVVSPYQSPRFLDELFYRFNPYFVLKSGDVRLEIGEILLGRPVKYPLKNLIPDEWKRDRFQSIPMYVNQLKKEDIPCKTKPIKSWTIKNKEKFLNFIDRHSCKRRTPLSKVLFPLRKRLGEIFPVFRIKRHDIAATEIR